MNKEKDIAVKKINSTTYECANADIAHKLSISLCMQGDITFANDKDDGTGKWIVGIEKR